MRASVHLRARMRGQCRTTSASARAPSSPKALSRSLSVRRFHPQWGAGASGGLSTPPSRLRVGRSSDPTLPPSARPTPSAFCSPKPSHLPSIRASNTYDSSSKARCPVSARASAHTPMSPIRFSSSLHVYARADDCAVQTARLVLRRPGQRDVREHFEAVASRQEARKARGAAVAHAIGAQPVLALARARLSGASASPDGPEIRPLSRRRTGSLASRRCAGSRPARSARRRRPPVPSQRACPSAQRPAPC